MKVIYLGHSCILVEVGGSKLLFDPFITPNELAKNVDADSLEPDFVFVSHGHQDHMADAESILKRTGATLIANHEIVTWFGSRGVENVHGMNHGGGFDFSFGRATMTNAIHSSSFPDGSYAGNPAGFVIESADGNFYFSGDTALTMDMHLIGETFELGWAALCIGDNYTMGAHDAARAGEFVGIRKALGIHYDTFPPIMINHDRAQREFAEKGIELILAPIGRAFEM